MIEPQNTMMPLPAESAPADVPHGEAGFGEMLAQSLGMIPQLDPSAIQQLAQNGEQQGDDPNNASAGGGSAEPETSGRRHFVSNAATLVDASAKLAEPVAVARPPFVDAGFVDPVVDGDVAVRPPTMGETAPVPGDLVPDPLTTNDGLWKPVLTDAPKSAAPAVEAGVEVAKESASVPADASPLSGNVATPNATTPGLVAAEPGVVDPPGRNEPAPIGPVRPEMPVTDNPVAPAPTPHPAEPVATEPIRTIGPVEPNSRPVVKGSDRSLPTRPAPIHEVANVGGNSSTPTSVPEATAPATTPTPIVRPQVDPVPTNPVRLNQAEIKIDGDKPVSLGGAPVSLDSGSVVTSNVASSSPFDAAPMQPSPVADLGSPTAPAAPTAHSALAERVLNAVELQANQPPPRTMVVDIPEIEGLRLVVSVRGGAEVHVVQSSASSSVNGLQPFMDELQGVLESRGFVMTGDGRRRNSNPHQDDEQPRPRSNRPTFRRQTDNDLRI